MSHFNSILYSVEDPLLEGVISNFIIIIKCSFRRRIFPESARWLAVKGYLTQAHSVLMTYASKSSLSVDSDSLKNELTEYYESELESRVSVSKRTTFLELFRSQRLRRRTAILCFNWYVTLPQICQTLAHTIETNFLSTCRVVFIYHCCWNIFLFL